jgi:hypothetical protein
VVSVQRGPCISMRRFMLLAPHLPHSYLHTMLAVCVPERSLHALA